jgi:hypothetical protein
MAGGRLPWCTCIIVIAAGEGGQDRLTDKYGEIGHSEAEFRNSI